MKFFFKISCIKEFYKIPNFILDSNKKKKKKD